MRLMNSKVTLTLLACSLASCASAHLNPAERAELDPTTPRGEVSLFHESSKIDRLSINDPGYLQETRLNVDRERTGVRFTYGVEYVQGYAELFSGELLGSSEEYGGLAIGAMAEVTLHKFDNGASLFLPYKIGLNLGGGEGDFGSERIDFATLETVADLGIGVEFRGWRPSLGVTSRHLRGLLEFNGEKQPDEGYDENDFNDLEADTVAGYVELAYRAPVSPLQVSVRVLSGEETGLYFGTSFLF